LCKYISNWYEGSGLPLEVIREFESILEEFQPFFMGWVEIVCNFLCLFLLVDVLLSL